LLLITVVSVSSLNVEEKKDGGTGTASLSSSLALLKNKYILMMVLAIFLYVGAEVCMSSGIPLYLESEFGINITEFGLLGTGLFFTTLMIGRFLGGTILNWMSPKKFFITTSIISVTAILGLFTGNSTIAVISVILLGLGFANIFPLVFSITVDSMPEKTNELSGLMVTAIVGGAIVPPIMGIVADNTSTLFGFVVPLIAMIYIGWTALFNLRKT
jgi:fucose permease